MGFEVGVKLADEVQALVVLPLVVEGGVKDKRDGASLHKVVRQVVLGPLQRVRRDSQVIDLIEVFICQVLAQLL